MKSYLNHLVQQCLHSSLMSEEEVPNQPLNNENSCYSWNIIAPLYYCWYMHCGSSRSTAALILKIHCCFDILGYSNSARKLYSIC
jgi:hypothetical protein